MSSWSSKNRQHWDEHATTYDAEPWQQTAIAQLSAELWARRSWIHPSLSDAPAAVTTPSPPSVKILDYACGPGSVSRTLAPLGTQCLGIDVSPGMVAVYNAKAREAGYGEEKMRAITGDLLATPVEVEGGEEVKGFDVAVVGMGFHHFEQPGVALRRLVEGVKQGGGRVVILDMVADGGVREMRGSGHGGGHGSGGHGHDHGHERHGHGHGHDHGHGRAEATDDNAEKTVMHNGFGKEAMKEYFTNAGCVDVEYVEVEKGLLFGPEDTDERKVFICKGTRKE